ncbi:ribosomal protein S18-alanine N-acetyltransferase [Lachnospiraceae bacterium 62-35]
MEERMEREKQVKKENEKLDRVRRMREDDIEEIAELERLCFSVPWSEGLLSEALESSVNVCFVLEEQKRAVAYGIFQLLAGEGEVLRIGVLPSERRMGLGSKVLEAMEGYARANQGERIFLEVRESNQGARMLYKSWGFQELGIRRNYYQNPREDAVLMRLVLV